VAISWAKTPASSLRVRVAVSWPVKKKMSPDGEVKALNTGLSMM